LVAAEREKMNWLLLLLLPGTAIQIFKRLAGRLS
jgi:hypothetical protein